MSLDKKLDKAFEEGYKLPKHEISLSYLSLGMIFSAVGTMRIHAKKEGDEFAVKNLTKVYHELVEERKRIKPEMSPEEIDANMKIAALVKQATKKEDKGLNERADLHRWRKHNGME